MALLLNGCGLGLAAAWSAPLALSAPLAAPLAWSTPLATAWAPACGLWL